MQQTQQKHRGAGGDTSGYLLDFKGGGRGRTRTYEGIASGFTVRPLCRSGHSPPKPWHRVDLKDNRLRPGLVGNCGSYGEVPSRSQWSAFGSSKTICKAAGRMGLSADGTKILAAKPTRATPTPQRRTHRTTYEIPPFGPCARWSGATLRLAYRQSGTRKSRPAYPPLAGN